MLGNLLHVSFQLVSDTALEGIPRRGSKLIAAGCEDYEEQP